jgi:putative oxidoreductase
MNMKKWLFATDSDSNLGLLILRVFIGAAMLTHGLAKIQGGVDGFTQNVANMGIPAAQVLGPLAVFAESGGALLLAIGLLTRPAAFLLVATMAVAVVKVHGGDGFSAQEAAWLYLVPALFFLLKGAGKWSVDALIAKKTP